MKIDEAKVSDKPGFVKYSDTVMDILEQKGFDKIVGYYKPPIELMSDWMSFVTLMHYLTGQTANDCADTVQNSFMKVISELFPIKVDDLSGNKPLVI
jgi:hypothetical protein